jgi:holin-like protein
MSPERIYIMKFMKQFAIILSVTFVGEILHYYTPLPVPGSIYGLVLMLILLLTGIIRIGYVKDTAEFLIEIMPMMFIPAGVGLLTAWGVLRPVLLPVAVMTVISTIVVLAVTGITAQTVMKIRKRETSTRDIVINAADAARRKEESELKKEDR